LFFVASHFVDQSSQIYSINVLGSSEYNMHITSL
jgi:hypothetical protein